MKTKLEKSPALYATIALLLIVLLVSAGFLFIDSVTEIMQKRRLANGVQIMATVTDQESRFNVVRGGGYNSYQIDYEFQYTDRQTGQLKKQVRADYPVYKKEYAAYTPGSTFIVSFIPGEPATNEPVATVGRLSPQTVLLTRLVTGLAFVVTVSVLILKYPRTFEWIQGTERTVAVVATVIATLVLGQVVGGALARVLEQTLL